MADAALERSRTMAAAGQGRAALANARQAARLYRDLAEQQPAVFQPDLALALQVVADLAGPTAPVGVAGSGRQDEALLAAREAVSIFRALAEQMAGSTHDDDPSLFRPYLGAALGTLAARLHATHSDDEALATVREGIHLFDNVEPEDLRRHRQALDAARLLRNELSPDEHLLDEEFGAMFADSPEA